jgi:branched-chain amino acid transport system ATP-binding protein
MTYSVLEACLRLPVYWKQEAAATNYSRELLSVFGMEGLAESKAGNLPYGAQRRLEIVRALATNPKVLLLDEPAAGMNPSETSELMRTIHDVRDKFGVAIILIEHDMKLVMGICERILVLNYGLIIAQGKPEEIRNNPLVIEAYLGQQRGEDHAQN